MFRGSKSKAQNFGWGNLLNVSEKKINKAEDFFLKIKICMLRERAVENVETKVLGQGRRRII